jgi:hypothetical protein
MWFDLLDHWQTFAAVVLTVGAAFIAGVFALGAAFIAVRAARQQERREVEALRLSLAVEIRRLVDVMLQTHEIFDRVSRTGQSLLADDVVKEISRGTPVVFPAMADRIGLLGFRVAPYVLTFYTNLDELEHAGRMTARDPAEPVPPDGLRELMKIIEGACRRNVLPLLSKLPRDKADPDTERKAKIEAMG